MEPRALQEVGLHALYQDVERPLIGVLARMERHGIRVDPVRLGEFSRELEVHLERTTREIFTLAGEEFNIGSPKQLAHILFEKLKLPPVRRTKTGYSTDADVLEHLALGHELPARIVEHRTLAKLKSTYADSLPTLINSTTVRIHTSFNQLVAATGRLSSSNPNVQNIPVRTELGRRIRAAFVPEPGWQFLAADYSQIELRILAHVSGEESLIEAFRRGEDIHRRTASEVFGVALEVVSPEQRDIAKTTNFSVIYGVTAFGLSRGLDMSPKQAQEFLDRFFARHPKVKAYLARTVAEGRERGFVSTLLGRRRTARTPQAAIRISVASASAWPPTRPSRAPPRTWSRSRWCGWRRSWTRTGSRAACCCRSTTSCCSRRRPRSSSVSRHSPPG